MCIHKPQIRSLVSTKGPAMLCTDNSGNDNEDDYDDAKS